MRMIIWVAAAVLLSAGTAFSEDLGNLSANPFDFESSSNQSSTLHRCAEAITRNAHDGSSRNREIAS